VVSLTCDWIRSASGFIGLIRGKTDGIADERQQHIAMLRILLAICETTLDAFRAADSPVDGDFVADLERITERTRAELLVLAKR
jgi:hypothetical protein